MLHSRLMRYVDEIARTGSIRRAARHLNVASSAINRQILAYEKELGHPIFERLPRGVRLTATGELLVEHIRATLKDHDRMLQRVGDLRTMRHRRITIATLETLTTDLLAQVVKGFQLAHPMVKVIVRAVSASAIADAVRSGEAEIGFGFDLPAEPDLEVLASVRCPLGVVVRPDHPLAVKASVRISHCVGYPCVLPPEHILVRTLFDRAARRARVWFDPIVETDSIDLLKRLAALANVVTVLTRADVELERQQGILAFVPLHGADGAFQTLSIVARASAQLNPATARFVEKLVEFVDRVGDADHDLAVG